VSAWRIPVEISLDDLAEQMTALPRKDVMAFLVRVDEVMADCEFTEELRDTLTAALAAEGIPQPVDATPFLQWLVRLDDPTDEQGVADRKAVNLNQIIGKARALLDGAA
jgi:hypothetical protein